MKRDTLSTLDLHEKPGQTITVFQHVRHGQRDGPVDLQPGERAFSAGPHHSFYSYTKETPMGLGAPYSRTCDCDCDRYETCAKCAKGDPRPTTDHTERAPPTTWFNGTDTSAPARRHAVADASPDLIAAVLAPPQTIELNIPRTAAERAARLETDSAKRKEYPVYSGVVRYFPDALAEIARLSFEGNKKHNPGEPLHWARGKSTDQLDCLVRHLSEAGTLDTDGIYHDVKIAWRALANLQTLLEKVKGLPISPGSRA